MRLPSSPDEIVLIHNPRCSKSRAVKALLEERGVEHTELRYLDEPLTREELEELARRLERTPDAWVRPGEAAYAEAGLGAGSSATELFEAMATRPSIVERPILVRGARARVGRPPEDVLELFD